MKLDDLYIIRGADDSISLEPLFWSNEFGYADIQSAEVYTKKEMGEFSLPIEGRWVRLSTAIAARDEWHEDIQKDAVNAAYSMPDTERL
jgi:hypothetical protein